MVLTSNPPRHGDDGLDAFAETDLETGLGDDVLPEGDQFFLADFAKPDPAVERQSGRLGHHDLAARKVGDRPTEAVLLDSHEPQLAFSRRQTRRNAGGPATDDDEVERVVAAVARELTDRGHGLATLLDRIADQPHATELSGDVNPGHIGLKISADIGDIDAARRRAEHERNGATRTRCTTRAMADTFGWRNQCGLAVDDPQDVTLGTRTDTGPAPDAQGGIDHRMQRCRLVETRLGRLHERRHRPRFGAAAVERVDRPNQEERRGVDEQKWIELHRPP